MIPREAPRAKSSPGQYYLRDKNGITNERVEFTYTLNLPTNDPDFALKVMEATAADQTAIKQRAGLKHPGRKSEKPFYTFSLSWHPEENPEGMHMVETGKSALAKLGLQQHQTVMVSHNDTDHKHIHCIVNLVHPETGLTGSLKHSRLQLSKWAEEYERERKIFCEQRIENNAKRDKNEYTVYDGYKHKERLLGKTWEHWENLDPAKRAKVLEHVKTMDRKRADGYVLFLKNHIGKDLDNYLESQAAPQRRKVEADPDPGREKKLQDFDEWGQYQKYKEELPKRQLAKRLAELRAQYRAEEEREATARAKNRLQDRQIEERGRLSDFAQKKRFELKELLDAQYSEHEKALKEKMAELSEIMQDERRLWILQRSGQDPEREMEEVKLTLENIAWRRQEAETALENSFTGQKQALQQRQEIERGFTPEPEKNAPAREFDQRAAFMERYSQDREQGMDFEP